MRNWGDISCSSKISSSCSTSKKREFKNKVIISYLVINHERGKKNGHVVTTNRTYFWLGILQRSFFSLELFPFCHTFKKKTHTSFCDQTPYSVMEYNHVYVLFVVTICPFFFPRSWFITRYDIITLFLNSRFLLVEQELLILLEQLMSLVVPAR
jgi:hypothetical protein